MQRLQSFAALFPFTNWKDGERKDAAGQRILRKKPGDSAAQTLSSRRLNGLAASFPRPPRYLEIGVQHGYTFENVRASVRIGVEPYPRFSLKKLPGNAEIFVGPSDDYFEQCESKFDLIFVDGLHEASQAYRDLINSFRFLSPGGAILLDDVFPLDEPSSLPSLEESNRSKREAGIDHPFWYGNVYKCLGVIQEKHPELDVVLVGGDPHHIQALIWKPDPDAIVAPAPSAKALMASWDFSDFFPDSDYVKGWKMLPERDAIRSVPITSS